MKLIYSGLEDSGKTYMLAVLSDVILKRNVKWAKKTGNPRPIVSNLPYSDGFRSRCEAAGIPLLHWKDLAELTNWQNTGVELQGADLFIDEVGTYFDSRTFKDLPLETRLWLAQASKMGVDIYGAAQDFAQVDKAFRRLTNVLYEIRKVVGSGRPHKSKPPVKSVWGVCLKQEMDPKGYKEDEAEMSRLGFPWPFVLRKKYTEIFDTNTRIPRSAPPPYKHVARKCEVPGCTMELYQSIHGVKHKISHV